MKLRVIRFAIIAPAAVAAAVLLPVAGAGAGAEGSPERGKAAFVRHGCWECHGYAGQGGITGPRLAPDPLPFDALSTFVRTTSRNMPPYVEAILSNDDLADIYAYLSSIPKGPAPASIPLLNDQ